MAAMRYVSKAELSRRAGVSRAAITKACKNALYDATTSKGVDVDHPVVREWLSSHGVQPSGVQPHPTQTERSPPPPTPLDLDNLDDMTVRDVVMRFGSVDGFKRFVDALRGITEFKYKELRAKQQRGQLIERSVVAGVVFPLVDAAFSRLVSDVPSALSKMLIARVQSGGPDTLADVQRMIQDANGRVLRNVKQLIIDKGVIGGD